MSSAEAGAEYRRRHGREPLEDVWLGWMLGGSCEVIVRVVRRLDELVRMSEGRRGRRGRRTVKPLPSWAEVGFRGAVAWLRAHPGVAGPALDGLRRLDPDVVLPDLTGGAERMPREGIDRATISRVADTVLARPAEKPGLLAFRAGVEAWFQARHGASVNPSQLALLSGFVGLESYAAVGPITTRWQDRIRRARSPIEDLVGPFVSSVAGADPTTVDAMAAHAGALLTDAQRKRPEAD